MLFKAKTNDYNINIRTFQKDNPCNEKNFITNFDVSENSEIILNNKIYVVKKVCSKTNATYNKNITEAYNVVDFEKVQIDSNDRFFYKVCIDNKFVNLYSKKELPLNSKVVSKFGKGIIISEGNFLPVGNIISAFDDNGLNIYQDGLYFDNDINVNYFVNRSYLYNKNNIVNYIIDDDYPFKPEMFSSINYLIKTYRISENVKNVYELINYYDSISDFEKSKYWKDILNKNVK